MLILWGGTNLSTCRIYSFAASLELNAWPFPRFLPHVYMVEWRRCKTILSGVAGIRHYFLNTRVLLLAGIMT